MKEVDTELVKHNMKETRAIPFGEYIHFKGNNIPTGKIIIDDENQKLLIYETFFREEENRVCLPDVFIFEFKNLQKCKIKYKYQEIEEEDIINIIFNEDIEWNMLYTEIADKNIDYNSFSLYLDHGTSFGKLIYVYRTINKIVEQQKNSIQPYTIS